jgi:sugar phosphate isomerase/epimerase
MPDYLDVIQRSFEGSGLKTVLFGGPGFDFTSRDRDVRKRELDEAAGFYSAAADRFDLSVCNILVGPVLNPGKDIPYRQFTAHGSFLADEEQFGRAAECTRELGRLAESRGFSLAFETHGVYLHDTPKAALRLTEAAGSSAVGINLDYGNILNIPGSPSLSETISMLQKHIKYVHLKNSIPVPGAPPIKTALSDGVINNREFLRLLKKAGYSGPVGIESPRDGDREWFAQEDIRYLKQVMKEVGW